MKYKNLFCVLAVCLTGVLAFTSCIKEEAPNAEADILSCEVDRSLLLRDPVIGNEEVKLYTGLTTDLTKVNIKFELTPGATLTSGTTREADFTQPQFYTVTSQDKRWRKTYKVSFIRLDVIEDFHFEQMRFYTYKDPFTPNAPEEKKYHILSEITPAGSLLDWGSGNAGFMITAGDAPAVDYPTAQADDGVQGKCVKLVTRSTGEAGKAFQSPIAAGNIFLGDFQLNFLDKPKSTHFGIPYQREPLTLSGYYKYKAGEVFTDKDSKVVAGKKDDFAIYAMLFEVTTDVPHLDGTNAQTSANIVKLAKLENRKETDEWTYFSIPFEQRNGKTIDPVKLKAGKYALSIVLSSSEDGAVFNGAVGSTLWVDELKIDVK